MSHSNSFGVKCPEPLEDKNGNFINSIKSKKFSFFTFLEGNSKKRWSGETCFKKLEKHLQIFIRLIET